MAKRIGTIQWDGWEEEILLDLWIREKREGSQASDIVRLGVCYIDAETGELIVDVIEMLNYDITPNGTPGVYQGTLHSFDSVLIRLDAPVDVQYR